MKKTVIILICAAALAWGQRNADYDASVVKQMRIDLRDLGYPPVDVIPSDETAIRALAVAPDGVLYGATSGNKSHLFKLDPAHGYVQPLGPIPGAKTVHHALAVSKAGDVYIGASDGVDNGGQVYKDHSGGHLLKYTPKAGGRRRSEPKEPESLVSDLGLVAEGEGIYSLVADREHDVLYGVTYPNGIFFSYNIAQAKFQQFGKLAERLPPGEKFEKEKTLGRALIVDKNGNVFTSGEGGHLYRFDQKQQALARLNCTVPTVLGREPYSRVDIWTAGDKGVLYGGSSDGYLFRLDPETLKVENLGKPLNQYRIRGLVFARNGKIYGVGGDDEEMARLFSLDPSNGVYEMLGLIDVNRRPYYSWQAYVIDAMALGLDGTVYLGQSERKSRLFVYHPE